MHTADDFVSAISRRWQDSVAAIIDVGKLLLGAKDALPHGEFGDMIKSDKVLFGWNTANRLMAIAKHSILANSDYSQNLPASWQTVYQLTTAPDPTLMLWLADGTIHPEMKHKDVLSLLRSLRSSTRKAIASRPGKYQLILADLPGKYDFMETDSRAIENQYETQDHVEIARGQFVDEMDRTGKVDGVYRKLRAELDAERRPMADALRVPARKERSGLRSDGLRPQPLPSPRERLRTTLRRLAGTI